MLCASWAGAGHAGRLTRLEAHELRDGQAALLGDLLHGALRAEALDGRARIVQGVPAAQLLPKGVLDARQLQHDPHSAACSVA